MEGFIKKIEQLKAQVNLASEDKAVVRERLVHFMRGAQALAESHPRHSLAGRFFAHPLVRGAFYAGLVIVAGGGISLASQSSLPGDFLYPVKVNFSEKAQSLLTFSAKEKAALAVYHAQERLDEAAELYGSGRLSTTTAELLETYFEEYAKAVEEQVSRLEGKGNVGVAAEVTADFEAALAAREQVMASLKAKSKKNGTFGLLQTKVNSTLDQASRTRATLESKAESAELRKARVEDAAKDKLNAAVEAIANVEVFAAHEDTGLEVKSLANVQARLSKAQSLVTSAEEKLHIEKYDETFALSNQAIRIAKEAKVLVQAQARLKNTLGINVDIPPFELDFEATSTTSGTGHGGAGLQGTTTLEADPGTLLPQPN